MRYCDSCASQHGWPPSVTKHSYSTCESCGDHHVVCSDRPIDELPTVQSPDFYPPAAAIKALVDLTKKSRIAAWAKYVRAVGDHASQGARYGAIRVLGWRPVAGLGADPAAEMSRLLDAVDAAIAEWQLWHEAARLVDKLEEKIDRADAPIRYRSPSPGRDEAGEGPESA